MNTLITGTSSGIGRALACRMVASGHPVWGVARREPELAALRSRLGGKFGYSAADVTDRDAARRVHDEMSEAGFAPEVVILNAGIFPHDCDGPFEYPVARSVLDTNIHGALSFVGEFLDPILARGGGQFLVVSSVFAIRPDPLAAGYSASKAALTMAFRSLSLRYRASPVQFKSVLLGPVVTERATAGRKEPALSLFFRTPDQAAAAIMKALRGRRRTIYFPWLLGMAFRSTAWLPDTAFQALIQPFRR